MKPLILIAGLLLASGFSANAQKADTTKKFSPTENREVNETNQLRKKIEQNQLNAPFEKLEAKQDKKQVKQCRKHARKHKLQQQPKKAD